MEIQEEKIARELTNIPDVAADDLHATTKRPYDRKINNLRKTIKGKLIVKEYPTQSQNATTMHC